MKQYRQLLMKVICLSIDIQQRPQKHTIKQIKDVKLKPDLVTFYDLQPLYGMGLYSMK